MKMPFLLLVAFGLLFSQTIEPPGKNPHGNYGDSSEVTLPNGKSQRDEILKAEHKKTLEDAAQLVKLSEELQDDLIKDDRYVLSLSSLKKAEDIEKLARKIRTRLKK